MKNNINLLALLLFFCGASFSQNKRAKTIHYYNPVWSPDGKTIAFESTMEGKSSIYIISPDGTNLKRITDTIRDYGQPRWSPDGKSLIYYGGVHPMQLFINAAAGGAEKQLPTPCADAYEPCWSLNNKIVFDSRPMGQTPTDISVMNMDGTGLKQITDGKYDYAAAVWSADGKTMILERSVAIRKQWKDITKEERQQMKDSAEVIFMNADGSGIRNLTHNAVREKAPIWSADGKAIYYLFERDSGRVLCTMKLSENKEHDLSLLKGEVYCVSVSPNGKYVAYASEREGKHAIYILDMEKKIERKLISEIEH